MSSTDYTLYGGTPPHVAGSDTSLAAAKSIKNHAGPMSLRIYRLILESQERGLTSDEVMRMLSFRHNTVTPRLKEMVQSGILSCSEQKRRTSSGRFAHIYLTVTNDPNPPMPKRLSWRQVAIDLYRLLTDVAEAADSGKMGDAQFRTHASKKCSARTTVFPSDTPLPKRGSKK